MMKTKATLLSGILGAALCLGGVYSVSFSAQAMDDVRFPRALWDADLLNMAEGEAGSLLNQWTEEVSPPLANDSVQTRAELDYLLALAEKARDEKTLERIAYEHDGVVARDIFKNEGLLPESNHRTIDLLDMVDGEQGHVVMAQKLHFSRARPNQLEERLELVLPNPSHASYPSGHASQAYMVALILSDFDPENGKLYKQFAYDIAHRREIAGFHYPSDSIAGRKLAVDVLEALRASPVFEKTYQDAKASYVKPDAAVIAKYRSELDARQEIVPLFPDVKAEWDEIAIEIK